MLCLGSQFLEYEYEKEDIKRRVEIIDTHERHISRLSGCNQSYREGQEHSCEKECAESIFPTGICSKSKKQIPGDYKQAGV